MRIDARKRSLYMNSLLTLERLTFNDMKTRIITLLFTASFICSCSVDDDNIKVNQVGFYPLQEKTFTLESGNRSKTVSIHRAVNGEKVWEGEALYSTVSPLSGKTRKVYDFSELNETGTYVIKAGKETKEIVISETALNHLSQAALLGFYHQRSGMDLDTAIAGQWARKGGHPDTEVLIHASAASESRPAGTVISSPKGWYDAGDYNKYIVNSGYSLGLIAEAFLMFPQQYVNGEDFMDYARKTRELYGPVFEELEYNEQWMWTMQDPEDGGVYHKLTTPNFEGFVRPTECSQPRYAVQKSVTAALDFAGALCAMAQLNLKSWKGYDINTRVATNRFKKAEAAYAWAKTHPDALYDQNKINETYDPDITTGTYGDSNADDEFFWAASELYIATKKAEYLKDVRKYMPESIGLMSWGYVAPLGVFSWLQYEKRMLAEKPFWKEMPWGYWGITDTEQEIINECRKLLMEYCDKAIKDAEGSCFNSAYGNKPEDFVWGCSSSFCDQAICFLYAYDLTGDEKYLKNAYRNVNYILGQNATGYCYVTGFGSKSPMHPHSRLCHSDGVEAPIPGLLVGGPNPGQQDIAEVGSYTSDYPDESYEDVMPSYASNEIAINWNASLLAATSWLAYLGEGLAK